MGQNILEIFVMQIAGVLHQYALFLPDGLDEQKRAQLPQNRGFGVGKIEIRFLPLKTVARLRRQRRAEKGHLQLRFERSGKNSLYLFDIIFNGKHFFLLFPATNWEKPAKNRHFPHKLEHHIQRAAPPAHLAETRLHVRPQSYLFSGPIHPGRCLHKRV